MRAHIYAPYLAALRDVYRRMGDERIERLPFAGVKKSTTASLARRANRAVRRMLFLIFRVFLAGNWIRASKE
jgi:hypothetical protein